MATSEIEKLERRYSENPHGLTFAPLAEVHRKNGDIARALELLTAGLELHPNYIPASIVLGRCHQDLGDLPAAEAAFAHVLRLDDENVIALKSLADINERLERYDHAVSWLRRLVTVDRSNEEAREQLRRLELVNNGRPSQAPAATTEAPIETAPKGPVVLELPPLDTVDSDLSQPVSKTAEPTAGAPPDVATPEPPEEPRSLVLERTQEFSEEAAGEIPSITDRPEPARTGSVPQMPGLVSQEFEPPKGPLGPPLESLEIDVETSDEVVLEGSGASEYRVPDASEDLGQLSLSGGAVSEYQTPDASEEFKALAEARAAAEAKAAAEARATAQAKAAADAKAAAEAKAAAKARAAAEAKAAAAASEAMEKKPDEEAKSPKRRYTARETQGQSVAAFFRGMLAARPPAETGEAGRPPQDGLPLGAAMGPEGAAKGDTEVSFDDFFGGQSKAGEADKVDEPGGDDLDQFQSWLQNLKR